MVSSRPPPRSSLRRFDVGRFIARALCVVFAVLGALPLGAGFAVRSEAAQHWVSRETALRLSELLGIQASYDVDLSLLPLQITLHNLRVESTDGGAPAVLAKRVAITPSVFALIAGKLDIGDIELDQLEQRLVIQDGKIQNVQYHLPETSGPGLKRAPFRSLSATDARLDLSLNGIQVHTGLIDLDVLAERDGQLDVALRMSESRVRYPETLFAQPPAALAKDAARYPHLYYDEDVLCQLDARLSVSSLQLVVRRLELSAVADVVPGRGSPAVCPAAGAPESEPGLLTLQTRNLRITRSAEDAPWMLAGNLDTRAPLQLLNRATGGAPKFEGWATLQGDLRYGGKTRIPEFTGKVTTGEFMLAGSRLADDSWGDVHIEDDVVRVPHLQAHYGGGLVDVYDVTIQPFAPGAPLHAKKVDGSGVAFPAMIKNIGITPNTVVQWSLDRTRVTDFGGTLSPPKLDGDMYIETSQFELFNRAYHDPRREHMLGVNPKATLRGRFGVRNDCIQFNDVQSRFGDSELNVTIHIGFENWVRMRVPPSVIHLADISPLVTVPLQGVATISAEMDGQLANPKLVADLSVDGLVFGGFPLGDLRAKGAVFRPLWVEIAGAELRKRRTLFRFPKLRLDFNDGADIRADLQAQVRGGDIRDFLAMWRFDEDPRWKDLKGRFDTDSRVRYVRGGAADVCGEGNLRVTGNAQVDDLTLFDERYDRAESSLDFHWQDPAAGYHGVNLSLPSFLLTKGSGSVVGNFQLSPGARVESQIIATRLPLSELQALGEIGKLASGDVSATGRLWGTLDELEAEVRATVSPVLLGRSRLPGSRLDVQLTSTPGQTAFLQALSRCKHRIPVPFDPTKPEEDKSSGNYNISGQLLGQQVMFDKFLITRQTAKVAKGGVIFNELNLAPLLELLPQVGLARQRPSGKLSGRLDLTHLPLSHPQAAQARADIGTLWVSWKGFRFSAEPVDSLRLEAGKLTATKLSFRLATPEGREAMFDVTGALENVTHEPRLNLDVQLKPMPLSSWAMLVPSLSEVSGSLQGGVHLAGPLSQPRPSGGFTLSGGRFVLQRQALTFSDVHLDLGLEPDAVVLKRASASVGGGRIVAEGRAPLRELGLGEFRGQVVATGVALPITDGVALEVDAALEAIWQPSVQGESGVERVLPKLTGSIDLLSFEYTRPVTMNADLVGASRRGRRTEFESYDPKNDAVELDLGIRSDRALRLNNNLMESSLRIEEPGLKLTGTNQRFGLRGRVRVEPGGRIRLRRNEFEVQSGEVRFDDATTIAPRVDLHAVTEYRRYSTSTSAGDAPGTSPAEASAGSTSGQWRIAMHAHGDADNLKIDLSSQPKLSEDDIFLLLTVGLTRTELDQAQSASLGESVALEALGSLTGADEAVTEAIGVIDEFRLGSAYSSRTGRTEPTVTVGKRLTERIRAFVTSGISETREVRSNLEWRLNPQVSVEGSYDNVNDISSSSLGNLGADVRWRLEFR